MIIYLSYNNACLRERKLTGRKCLKQKWLKKEEFLRRVGWSGFAENRARISYEQAETLWSGQIWGLGGQPTQPNALLLLKSYWKARFTLFRAAWVLSLRRGCSGFTWKSQKPEVEMKTYCETRSPPYQDGRWMLGELQRLPASQTPQNIRRFRVQERSSSTDKDEESSTTNFNFQQPE